MGTDMHAHVVMPVEGTNVPPMEVGTQHEEPTLHAPTDIVGGELSPLPALNERVGSEEDSSDLGRNSSSCFDYSAVDHGHPDATKNDAFEPIDGDADEPPDAA